MAREDDFVVLRNYSDPLTAQFIRALLEEHEIPAMLKDLNFNFPTGIFSSKSAGIKLLVLRKDIERAEEVLEEK